MQITEITPIPPCAAGELPVANQVLVTIAVEDGKLSLYPDRGNDVVVFHRSEGYHPERPNQVRWVAVGLSEGQEIVLEPKANQPDVFDEIHHIEFGKNSVCSGSPKRSPDVGTRLFWNYTIKLVQDGKQIDEIDPGVEIKDDP